jgi:prephenate dehydrogenase
MTDIQQYAKQVEGAVRVGDALNKSEAEIQDEVTAIVGHLPFAALSAVLQHVRDSNARDCR